MHEPVWIVERAALAAHARVLNEHRGHAYGHDRVRLAAALSLPMSARVLQGGRVRLASLAATYAWAINRLQPFEEGNAATACLLSMLFLRLNGVTLPAPAAEKFAVYDGLAAGSLVRSDLVQWMKVRHLVNLSGAAGAVAVRVAPGRVAQMAVGDVSGAGRRVSGGRSRSGPPAPAPVPLPERTTGAASGLQAPADTNP